MEQRDVGKLIIKFNMEEGVGTRTYIGKIGNKIVSSKVYVTSILIKIADEGFVEFNGRYFMLSEIKKIEIYATSYYMEI